jgi:acetyl esterase/lipase
MGHSAGAHLAALVASDPQYAGEAFGAIRGVVLLDGAGYDVMTAAATPTMELPTLYKDVFGTDPARQKALSPITHVGGKDAPHWLALYVAERPGSKMQSEALMGALAKAGKDASAVAITGTDHGRMNRELGTEAGKAQTEAVDAFLKRVLG